MTETARARAYELLRSGHDTPGFTCDDQIFAAETPDAAFAGTMSWADCARGTEVVAKFPQFGAYHADRFPLCPGLGATACFTKHCATDVLFQSIRTLRDERRSEVDRRVALKMFLHLLGDLHQPLHVTATGPHEVSVIATEGAAASNFHGYWDSYVVVNLLKVDLASVLELAAENKTAFANGELPDWILATHVDGQTLAYGKLYDGQDMCAVISNDPVTVTPEYEAVAKDLGRRKLAEAGIRMAKILNEIFAPKTFSQTIQAEDYASMQGVQTAATTDTFGGEYVGWIEAGDFMVFDQLEIAKPNVYSIDYRVATKGSTGSIQTDLGEGSELLGTMQVPSFGDWERWTTLSHLVSLPAGRLDLRLLAQAGGWNLNWLRVEAVDRFFHVVEAEKFTAMTGGKTGLTRDWGGTEFVGWLEDGASATYSIEIPFPGSYRFVFRVANASDEGRLVLDTGEETTELANLSVPVTGAEDTWTTIEKELDLEKGTFEFRIVAAQSGWNLNFIEITAQNKDKVTDPPDGVGGADQNPGGAGGAANGGSVASGEGGAVGVAGTGDGGGAGTTSRDPNERADSSSSSGCSCSVIQHQKPAPWGLLALLFAWSAGRLRTRVAKRI